MVDNHHGSFHVDPYHGSSKSMDDKSRLRKLTSLSYLGGKLRIMFQRELRDTILCEDELLPRANKRNLYEIIHCNDKTTSPGFDPLIELSDSVRLAEKDEPSKAQRSCTNCSKCFQRELSRFDQYCGLDCKTAHRMRQASHYLAYQSSSLVSEDMLAVRAAAARPPPRFTTRSATS